MILSFYPSLPVYEVPCKKGPSSLLSWLNCVYWVDTHNSCHVYHTHLEAMHLWTNHTTACDRLRALETACDCLRSHGTACDRLRPLATACDRLRPLATAYDSLQQLATTTKVGCNQLQAVVTGALPIDTQRRITDNTEHSWYAFLSCY